MKIKIKRYTAVAAWRWNGVEDDDVCGICRRQYDATCPECKYPGEGCPLAFGECGHAFHNHCLNTWLAGSITANGLRNTKCPMCRAEFVQRLTQTQKKRQEEEEEAKRAAAASGSGAGSQQPRGNPPQTPGSRSRLRGRGHAEPTREAQQPDLPEEEDDDDDAEGRMELT